MSKTNDTATNNARKNPQKIDSAFSRRQALAVLGAGTLGVGALGAGLGAGCGTSASTSTPTDGSLPDAGVVPRVDGATTDVSDLSCVLTPEATEGPFFVDEKLNRSDLTAGETDPAVVGGYPLTVSLRVFGVNGSMCVPFVGATVDVWHANVTGLYSDEASSFVQMTDTTGTKYLRGYQVTDDAGTVTFKTIYPGWYFTRTVHVHYKIRIFSSVGDKTFESTGQMYFDDAVTNAVFAMPPYAAHGPRSIPMNTNDQVFNGTGPGSAIDTPLPAGQVPPGSKTIAVMTPMFPGPGYKATLKIGVLIP